MTDLCNPTFNPTTDLSYVFHSLLICVLLFILDFIENTHDKNWLDHKDKQMLI